MLYGEINRHPEAYTEQIHCVGRTRNFLITKTDGLLTKLWAWKG